MKDIPALFNIISKFFNILRFTINTALQEEYTV